MAKLAAFDMDGTLLMPDHRLGEQTLRALGRLQASGVTLAFATGRHTLEMRYLMRDLDLDAYLIAGNGTRVHARDGAVLHRCDLAPDVAEVVLHSRWNTRLRSTFLTMTAGLPTGRRPRCWRPTASAIFATSCVRLKRSRPMRSPKSAFAAIARHSPACAFS